MNLTFVEGLLLASIVLPFVFAVLIGLVRRSLRNSLIVALPFLCTCIVFTLAINFFHEPTQTIHYVLGSIIPGLEISFHVEAFGMVFACLLAVLWPISMLYSLAYLDANNLKNTTSFCVYFYLAIACALAIAFAGDLLTLFIFYEALTLVTYPLVTHSKTPQAQYGGRVYLAFLLGTSIFFFLPALIWIWLQHSTLSFVAGGFIPDHPANALLLLVFAFGIGKAALVPLHAWLPAAMVAPAPVSALLHAVAVVKAGVFTFLKIIVFVFGIDETSISTTQWLIYIVGGGAVVASVLALKQTSLKRMLAYSTVGQLAYIVLGSVLLKPVIVGTFIHLIGHAFGKITLFFAAGAIQTTTGKTKISQLRGIAYTMPWTMGIFTLAALSLIGLPPTAGSISKWIWLQGALGAEQYFAVAVIAIGTLLSVAYLGRVVYIAFQADTTQSNPPEYKESSPGLLLPMLLCAIGVVALFFLAPSLAQLMTTFL